MVQKELQQFRGIGSVFDDLHLSSLQEEHQIFAYDILRVWIAACMIKVNAHIVTRNAMDVTQVHQMVCRDANIWQTNGLEEIHDRYRISRGVCTHLHSKSFKWMVPKLTEWYTNILTAGQ